MDDDALRKTKLAKLIEIEGYDSIDELMEAVFSDSVSPAICMNEGCDFTCEMEPDQGRRLLRGVPYQRAHQDH